MFDISAGEFSQMPSTEISSFSDNLKFEPKENTLSSK
jgi:hypothetical protein